MNRTHYYSFLFLLLCALLVAAQDTRPPKNEKLPKDVRGYKVERAQVQVKKPKPPDKGGPVIEEELLVKLGEAKLITVSPLGVTFEVPVILAPVKQQGKIDRLVFEDILINEKPVTIDDYVYPFALPNKEPLNMLPPLRVFVSSPRVVMTTIDEILNSQAVWPVRGRVYVCGHFKKFLFTFKRAVPVELQTTINNPLR